MSKFCKAVTFSKFSTFLEKHFDSWKNLSWPSCADLTRLTFKFRIHVKQASTYVCDHASIKGGKDTYKWHEEKINILSLL